MMQLVLESLPKVRLLPFPGEDVHGPWVQYPSRNRGKLDLIVDRVHPFTISDHGSWCDVSFSILHQYRGLFLSQ